VSFLSGGKMRLVLVLSLVLALSGLSTKPVFAINAQIIKTLLDKMAKGSEDAIKHGDEVLKKANPDQLNNTPPALSPNNPGARNAARSGECSPAEIFPEKNEIIIILAKKVNIRKCGSTKCSVVARIKKGKYRINAIKRENCWVNFKFQQQNGIMRSGFIHEKYATVR